MSPIGFLHIDNYIGCFIPLGIRNINEVSVHGGTSVLTHIRMEWCLLHIGSKYHISAFCERIRLGINLWVIRCNCTLTKSYGSKSDKGESRYSKGVYNYVSIVFH